MLIQISKSIQYILSPTTVCSSFLMQSHIMLCSNEIKVNLNLADKLTLEYVSRFSTQQLVFVSPHNQQRCRSNLQLIYWRLNCCVPYAALFCKPPQSVIKPHNQYTQKQVERCLRVSHCFSSCFVCILFTFHRVIKQEFISNVDPVT